MPDESIILCPKGHSVGLTRVSDMGNPRFGLPNVLDSKGVSHEICAHRPDMKQVPAIKGFAFPCPNCMRFYWDNGSGIVSLLSPIQFVATYLALDSSGAILSVAQMQMCVACLKASAETIVIETMKRGLREEGF